MMFRHWIGPGMFHRPIRGGARKIMVPDHENHHFQWVGPL